MFVLVDPRNRKQVSNSDIHEPYAYWEPQPTNMGAWTLCDRDRLSPSFGDSPETDSCLGWLPLVEADGGVSFRRSWVQRAVTRIGR